VRNQRNSASTPAPVCFFGQNPISLNYLTHVLRGQEFLVLDEDRAYEHQGSSPLARLVLVLDEALLAPGSRLTMRSLRTRFPEAKLLMLGTALPSAEQWHLLRGIDGLVLYSEAKENLIPALRALRDGRMWLPRQMLECFARSGIQADRQNRHFTKREQEIIPLMEQGLVNKEIAAKLGIAEKTVKFHASNLYAKLGVHDRNSAVDLAHSLHAFRNRSPFPMQRAARAA